MYTVVGLVVEQFFGATIAGYNKDKQEIRGIYVVENSTFDIKYLTSFGVEFSNGVLTSVKDSTFNKLYGLPDDWVHHTFCMYGVPDLNIPLYKKGLPFERGAYFSNLVFALAKIVEKGVLLGFVVIVDGKVLKLQLKDLNTLYSRGYTFCNISRCLGTYKEKSGVLPELELSSDKTDSPQTKLKSSPKLTVHSQSLRVPAPTRVKTAPMIQVNSYVPVPVDFSKYESLRSEFMGQLKRPFLSDNTDLQTAARYAVYYDSWDDVFHNCREDGQYFFIKGQTHILYEVFYTGESLACGDAQEYMSFGVHVIFDKDTPKKLIVNKPTYSGNKSFWIDRCIYLCTVSEVHPVDIETDIEMVTECAFVPHLIRNSNLCLRSFGVRGLDTFELGSWAFYGCDNLKVIGICSNRILFHQYAVANSGVVEAHVGLGAGTGLALFDLQEGCFSGCKNLEVVNLQGVFSEIPSLTFCGSPLKKLFMGGVHKDGERYTIGHGIDLDDIPVSTTAFTPASRVSVSSHLSGFNSLNEVGVQFDVLD